MQPSDELVTEEMISEAIRVYRADERIDTCMGKVLRVVAPMIVARAMDDDRIRDRVVAIAERLVAAEKERCARIAERAAEGSGPHLLGHIIAAKIRGGTP